MLEQLFQSLLKLNRKKFSKARALVSLTLLISIFTGTLEAYAESTHLVRIVIDGTTKAVRIGDIKVSELLERNDIKLHEKDIINLDLDYLIEEDTVIDIDTAEHFTFEIEGEESINFVSNSGVVAVALQEFEKETGRTFKLKEGQSPAKNLTNDMIIKVLPYSEETKIISEKIPFETTYVENPDLLEGTENVKEEGAYGSKQITIKETYVNNELESSEVVSENIIKSPVNKVIEKGTKKQVVQDNKSQKEESYIKKLKMKSTAYTAGPESTGKNPGDAGYGVTASGMKAKRGVVAVDTSVIPFGTKLYIEGYGYAVAGDTGGAIKGNKIDVFVDSYREAMNWGVRTVDVYILE